MLQVNHLNKSYRTGNNIYPVLKDVSFHVQKRNLSLSWGLPAVEKLHF